MPIKIRTEFKRSKIGPTIFDDNGLSTGKQVPLDLLDKPFRVLQIKYDHNDRTLASDLLWATADNGNTAIWLKRGDTYEVIEKVRPLKRTEQDELVAAMKGLIHGYTSGDCYKTMNPAGRPYVERALKLLAKIEGKESYLNVKVG